MSFTYANHFTPAHQATLDRMVASMGETDLTALLASLSTEGQLHLVEAFGRYGERQAADAVAPLAERAAYSEGQTANLQFQVRSLEESLQSRKTDSVARPKAVKLDVAKFSGAESDQILRWILQVSIASDSEMDTPSFHRGGCSRHPR